MIFTKIILFCVANVCIFLCAGHDFVSVTGLSLVDDACFVVFDNLRSRRNEHFPNMILSKRVISRFLEGLLNNDSVLRPVSRMWVMFSPQ